MMKRFLILFAVVALILTFTACNKNTSGESSSESDGANTEVIVDEAEKEVETYTISVCGLDLKYPVKWKDKVTVTTTDDSVSFSSADTKLFDLTFNKDEGTFIGTIKDKDNMVVRFVGYDIGSDNPEVSLMQEDVNVIIQNLAKDYSFVTDTTPTDESNGDTYDIVTPVVTFKYPSKWKDKVQTQVTNLGVIFTNNGTPLFDLVFTECNGFLLGRYNGTPIYVMNYDVSDPEQLAMKDDINVIIDNLKNDSNFEISE